MQPFSQKLYPSKGGRKNIFFSGKGGVGKTSMACITAVQTALKGYKTLLLTTDPAAHIGSVLDKPIHDTISQVDGVEHLFAVKIDQKKATEEYKAQVLHDADSKYDPTTVMAMKEELDSPCTEEMASFQKFMEFAGSDDYEIVVVDTAPTGHTLRLLELPMDWSKQIQLKAGLSMSVSEEDQRQKERFDKVIDMMKNEETTTFAFVMYPERTPIIEAYRASQELETLDIKTQMVIANLVIPEEQAQTPFFIKRRNMQMAYINEMKEQFPHAQLLKVPMFEQEIKGIDMLMEAAAMLYEE